MKTSEKIYVRILIKLLDMVGTVGGNSWAGASTSARKKIGSIVFIRLSMYTPVAK